MFFSCHCHGFTRSILRISPTDILTNFTFVNEEFFTNDGNTVDDKTTIRLQAKVVDKKLRSDDSESGEQMIIIENQDQINCLRSLLLLSFDART